MITKGKLLVGLLVVGLPAAAFGVNWAVNYDSGLAPEGMRTELSRDIVSRWQPYVDKTYGSSAQGWGDRMQATFATADIANLERAASATNFRDMTHALLGGAGSVDMAGAPDTTTTQVTTASFGSPGSELVYTPLTPCRVVDTRVTGGAFALDSTRSYNAFTSTDFTAQGGDATNCNIPSDVSALTVKIVAVNPLHNGYFTSYPTNETKPLASALNYSLTGPTIYSNEAHIKLCRPGCEKQFSIYSSGQTHLVIDVTGYYKEPTATALDCTYAQQTGMLDLLGGLQTRTIDCPANYTATSGTCTGALGLTVSGSDANVVNGRLVGWKCDLVGSILSAISYKATATCCRVPGS